MADVDWEAEGVCKPCADEMREEWAQERGRGQDVVGRKGRVRRWGRSLSSLQCTEELSSSTSHAV